MENIDLDAPTPTAPAGRRGGEAKSAAAASAQHYPSPRAQAPPPQNNRRYRKMRGRPSYHFSIKRPRRNVVRRSIASLPTRLEDIEEEKEMLLGINVAERDGGHDPYRAPRTAMALFLIVCFGGAYRSFNEYWMDRKNELVTVTGIEEGIGTEDLTKSFRGAGDADHREALLLGMDGLDGETTALLQNIEEIPTTLFDETIEAPYELSNLANIFHEQYNPQQNKLFIWHIPRSGSTSITRIASYCMGLSVATEAGKSEVKSSRGRDTEIRIIEGLDGMHFANVDTSNPEGIALAKKLNVGRSEQIDLVSSPYLWDLAGIFDEVHKGYMVAMFRHPIERATSLYYSMRKNPMYEKQVGSLTSVEQYAKSSLVENNWMTRFLSNTLSGELTPEHEAIAQEVLRTKCLIGLLHDKTETMRRLQIYFNLNAKNERTQRREECQEKLLYWDWPGKNRHEPVVQGSEAWDTLYKQNTFDLRLYEYAERLFEAQGKLFLDTQSSW